MWLSSSPLAHPENPAQVKYFRNTTRDFLSAAVGHGKKMPIIDGTIWDAVNGYVPFGYGDQYELQPALRCITDSHRVGWNMRL